MAGAGAFAGDQEEGKHIKEHGPWGTLILRHLRRALRCTPPSPCASTATVPKNQAKQRFNAHPVLRQDRAYVWHT